MGGTELTAARVAEMLAAHHELYVLQHCRNDSVCSVNGVRYESGGSWRTVAVNRDFDIVIIINSFKLLALWRRHARAGTRLILWRHNFIGATHKHAADLLTNIDAFLVCVSEYHKRHSLNVLGVSASSPVADRLRAIYNPVVTVEDEASDDASAKVDVNQLLFASSPHKGLPQVVENFSKLKARIPELKLLVCNPGYLERPLPDCPGVQYTGKLRPAQVHALMRRSLCLFNAQSTFAETFGLVFAESQRMGTPVVAQRGLGAVDEVVGHDYGQALDVDDEDQVYASVMRWRSMRPQLSLNPAFAAQVICRQWLELLTESMKSHYLHNHEPGRITHDLS